MHDLYTEFLDSPMISLLEVQDVNKPIKFPSVFLCPEKIIYKELLDDWFYKRSEDQFQNERAIFRKCLENHIQYKEIYKVTDEDCKQFFDPKSVAFIKELTKDLLDVKNYIQECFFEGSPVNCSLHFGTFVSEWGVCFYFNSKFLNQNKKGKAYFIQETGFWNLKFSFRHTSDAINVFLLDSSNLPTLQKGPDYTWHHKGSINLKFELREMTISQDVKRLLVKQRNCLLDYEVPLDKKSLERYKDKRHYRQGVCIYNCHAMQFEQHCKCIPDFYKNLFQKMPIASCQLKQMNCIQKYRDVFMTHPCHKCLVNCVYNMYSISQVNEDDEVLNEGFANFTLELQNWPYFFVRRSVIFGWIELFLSLGGVFSLTLGISLVNIIEIIYFFTLNLICKFLMNKNGMLLIGKKKVQKLPRIELSLRPNF